MPLGPGMITVGFGNVEVYVSDAELAVQQAAMPRLVGLAIKIRDRARASMLPGHGRPSKPGHPPNVQTGRLQKAIKVIAKRAVGSNQYRSKMRVGVGWTSAAPYGKIHEEGGMYHPKRPFLKPARDWVMRHAAQAFTGLDLERTPAGQRLRRKRGRR